MISTKIITRFFHSTSKCFAIEKSLLASLRKKTGYTFTNCKKALEMHNNDLQQAEKWLRQQAQALGWAKATKLGGRETSQGLVGLALEGNHAAIIEVNCETDFVARNHQFQELVKVAVSSCLTFAKNQNSSDELLKIMLSSDEVRRLQASDGKLLEDHLVLMIGLVSENSSFKRGFCIKSNNDVHLCGYVHPSSDGFLQLGKIGALLALKSNSTSDFDPTIGRELCQHIAGMNPKKIGTETDKPALDKEEEICLIHQDFLLDETITVKQLLDENNIEIIDFKRFECGETVIDDNLEQIETCQ